MKFSRIVRRVDFLLVALALLLSGVIYLRFAPPVEEAQVIPVLVQDAQTTRSDSGGKQELDPPYKSAPIGSPVRFLMLNARNYFVAKDVPRTRNKRRLKSVEEREAVADTIASVHPEVVGLVEMGGQAALEDLAQRLEARGLNYPHRRVLERWGEDRALAILSCHPIARDDSVANCLLGERTSQCMRRGILDVTVKVGKDGRMFRIMGVHLKPMISKQQNTSAIVRQEPWRTICKWPCGKTQRCPFSCMGTGMPVPGRRPSWLSPRARDLPAPCAVSSPRTPEVKAGLSPTVPTTNTMPSTKSMSIAFFPLE